MNEKNKTPLKKKSLSKTRVSYCILRIEGFGIWISKRTVRGFLCTLSAVCDSGRGTIPHPMESPILSRESAQPFAPLKKRICSATRTRTLSLNINNICLVTKHELSMGRSTAAERETCQARERSAVRSDGWIYGGRIKRCGEKKQKKNAGNEIHIFPHEAPKTDQKLTDNLLSPSPLQCPVSWYIRQWISSCDHWAPAG